MQTAAAPELKHSVSISTVKRIKIVSDAMQEIVYSQLSLSLKTGAITIRKTFNVNKIQAFLPFYPICTALSKGCRYHEQNCTI